jgi:iron complex transport system substrate-binding protein
MASARIPPSLGAPLSRRRFIGAGLGALALGIVGCGDDEPQGGASGGAATTADAGSFPVTVEHVHGETTIPSAPARVVSYGYTDADTILALGTVPVGVLQWIPSWKRGVGPWSEAALGSAKPEIYAGSEIDFEGIAKVAPDLISIVNHDIDRATYDKLSKIAPTVPTVAGYPAYGTPWDVASVQIATALGKRREGQALVAKAKAAFTRVREDHPDWAGKRVVMVSQAEGGKLFVFADTDTRGRFVTSLGFDQSPEITKLTGGEFYAQLSAERFDLIDGDGLIVLADLTATQGSLEKQATFRRLRVVREGHVVTIRDEDLNMALSASTPTAIPYALDRLVPRLEEALAA